jgi:hypothetical protein
VQTKAQITHVESTLFYCAVSYFLVTRSQLLRAPFPVLIAFPRLGFPTYCYAYSALLSEVRDACYISLLECYVLLSPVDSHSCLPLSFSPVPCCLSLYLRTVVLWA